MPPSAAWRMNFLSVAGTLLALAVLDALIPDEDEVLPLCDRATAGVTTSAAPVRIRKM